MIERILPFRSSSFKSGKTAEIVNQINESERKDEFTDSEFKGIKKSIWNHSSQVSLNDILFQKTLDENYFQLPEITHADGTKILAKPDFSQIEAAKSLYNGENTICVKPTGTGKTADALYVITKNFKEGKRTFYTTPLKALSNDKYREFTKIYGKENIGLLTGDIKLNKNAPIVIMTTEIYRNMALSDFSKSQNKNFKGVKTVVFDEAHYISDLERGAIWEESVMLTPKNVQILALSGTVGNAAEFTNWIGTNTPNKTYLVESSPKNRHVPLIYYTFDDDVKDGNFIELVEAKVNVKSLIRNYYENKLAQRQQSAIEEAVRIWKKHPDDEKVIKNEIEEFFDTLEKVLQQRKYKTEKLNDETSVSNVNFRAVLSSVFNIPITKSKEISQVLIDSKSRKIKQNINFQLKPKNQENYIFLVKSLERQEMLPAIIFKFSRRGCTKNAVSLSKRVCLTTDDEQKQIVEIINKYSDKGIFFGDSMNLHMLLSGIGIHHAGILPSYKKLVEELFSKKLLKVVLATSTLSAGINMPARTVVMTDITRPDGIKNGLKQQADLTSNEFHQMAGRSGRRGIDTIGNVVLYGITNENINKTCDLILSAPDKLKSQYKPSYNLVMGFYERYKNDDYLDDYISKTYKVFQAENPEKEIKQIKKSFDARKNVLHLLGFLSLDDMGCYPTAKGRMLAKTHGYNEIVLTEMLYGLDIERLNISELAGFAASLNAHRKQSFKKEDEIDGLPEFSQALFDATLVNEIAKQYEKENEVTDSGNKISHEAAMIVQQWVEENSKEENSIRNWRYVMSLLRKYDHNASEGDLFMIISQATDILKQIINICEYALTKSEFAEKKSQFSKIIEKADYAVELMKKPPVFDNIN